MSRSWPARCSAQIVCSSDIRSGTAFTDWFETATKALESALAFYKGLKVYPAPGDLIRIYDSTVPKVR